MRVDLELLDLNEASMTKPLGVSLFIHLVLCLFFFMIEYIWNKSDPIDLSKIKMLQSAVRVDIVAMPKYTLKELESMTESSQGATKEIPKAVKESQASTNDKSEGPEFIDNVKKINLQEMLKNISKKKIKKKSKNNAIDGKITETSIGESELKRLLIAGNKLSKGTSLTGEISSEDLSEYEKYIFDLPDIIRPYWKIPSYLKNQELKCRIRVYIGKEGQLLKTEIFESSQSEEYDHLALLSIKKASPFPAPPEKFLNKVVQGEIILGFPL